LSIKSEIQMRKVKLSIETLQVESFETAASGAELRGTVAAHMPKPTPPAGTQFGDTCQCTYALSCVQTDCGDECLLFTLETCPPWSEQTCVC
jgi:hypothetical protein